MPRQSKNKKPLALEEYDVGRRPVPPNAGGSHPPREFEGKPSLDDTASVKLDSIN